MGSYHGMTLKSVTEGNQPKKPVAAVQPMPTPQAPLASPVTGVLLCFQLMCYFFAIIISPFVSGSWLSNHPKSETNF